MAKTRKWEVRPQRKSRAGAWIRQFAPSSQQVWNPEANEGIMIFPHPRSRGKEQGIPSFAVVKYEIRDGQIEWKPRFLTLKGRKTITAFDIVYIDADQVGPFIEALQKISGAAMPTMDELKKSAQQLKEEHTRELIKKFRL